MRLHQPPLLGYDTASFRSRFMEIFRKKSGYRWMDVYIRKSQASGIDLINVAYGSLCELRDDYNKWLMLDRQAPWSTSSTEAQLIYAIRLDPAAYTEDINHACCLHILAQYEINCRGGRLQGAHEHGSRRSPRPTGGRSRGVACLPFVWWRYAVAQNKGRCAILLGLHRVSGL